MYSKNLPFPHYLFIYFEELALNYNNPQELTLCLKCSPPSIMCCISVEQLLIKL